MNYLAWLWGICSFSKKKEKKIEMLKKCLWGRVVGILDWRRFPNVKTGREDHGCTRHFGNETGFFQEVLLKNHILSFVHNIYDENGLACEFDKWKALWSTREA